MTNIYDQHDAAFRSVSAYVVVKNGERVATVAFKFPSDGAGRLYAYVHWLDYPMERGFAGGCGYDKKSAACYAAALKMRRQLSGLASVEPGSNADLFMDAMGTNDGYYWNQRLDEAGFELWQVL